MDPAAALVQALVEVVLLALRDVPAVLGFILVQTGLLAREFRIVSSCLLRVDLAVGHALVNAVLLILDASFDFVDAWMAGIGNGGLRHHDACAAHADKNESDGDDDR